MWVGRGASCCQFWQTLCTFRRLARLFLGSAVFAKRVPVLRPHLELFVARSGVAGPCDVGIFRPGTLCLLWSFGAVRPSIFPGCPEAWPIPTLSPVRSGFCYLSCYLSFSFPFPWSPRSSSFFVGPMVWLGLWPISGRLDFLYLLFCVAAPVSSHT